MSTLAQLKKELNIESLNLRYQLDENKERTEWLTMWINEGRKSIIIHQELVEHIKANPDESNLAIKIKPGEGKQGPYTKMFIIKPLPADIVL